MALTDAAHLGLAGSTSKNLTENDHDRTLSGMEKDSIDELIEDWGRERPDLDFNAMHVVGRILVLALIMGRSASDVLGKQDLSLWAFDVLATLRRKGEPFRLSPSEISREVMLSPAAMVNRLDRLEQVGYVRRIPNPRDRRGVIVADGRKLASAGATCKPGTYGN